jgi:heme-degrading monooxygenase HmoA
MKYYSSLPATLLAMILFCMISCGEQNESETSEVTNDTTASSTTSAPSTIVTTPQHMMIVRHKVADFEKFMTAYEAHDSLRTVNGVRSYVIGRGITDPNMVLVATKVDDIEKAKAFGQSSALKQAMQKAGSTGKPEIRFTTMTYQDTGMISGDLRSRTTFTVKDWDSWQRSFDSSRQVRVDNGLLDRAYGHEVDNNKKVTVVVAVTDTAKANAFWKSDQLKQLRARSGAIGQPERFLFRVVKRY